MQAFGSSTTETAASHAQRVDLVSNVLRTAGVVKIKALGSSMLPTIWPADILVIEASPRDEVMCGDLVAVHTEAGIRVHRLRVKHESYWITRGDAMPQSDPAISPEDVLGRVSEIRRGRRSIIPQRRMHARGLTLAWLLSYSQICRIALRLRSAWINRRRQAKATQLRSHKLAS